MPTDHIFATKRCFAAAVPSKDDVNQLRPYGQLGNFMLQALQLTKCCHSILIEAWQPMHTLQCPKQQLSKRACCQELTHGVPNADFHVIDSQALGVREGRQSHLLPDSLEILRLGLCRRGHRVGVRMDALVEGYQDAAIMTLHEEGLICRATVLPGHPLARPVPKQSSVPQHAWLRHAEAQSQASCSLPQWFRPYG